MKVLITAGGTSEKIDEVRKITNMSTGRLGAAVAEEFMALGSEITYLCGTETVIPNLGETSGAIIIKIGSVEELKNALTDLLSGNKYDAVVHAMAVSDYVVKSTVSADYFVNNIAAAVSANPEAANNPEALAAVIKNAIVNDTQNTKTQKKISSDMDNLLIYMNKAPKVIKMIKQLQPETVLVGFKLLVGADDNVLVDAALRIIRENNCNFVLANDLDKIDSDRHEGLLVKADSTFKRLGTKREIAKAITEAVAGRSGYIT